MTNHVRSVFLIRHGRTSYNAAHKLQGQVDIPLDAVGEWQVKQTAAALKSLYVDRRPEINHRFIVCSDLKRAHATAQAFADVLGGIEPVDDRRVRERSFGDWDGHAVAELAERYPEDLFVFSHGAWIAQTLQTLLGISAIDPTFSTVVSLRNAHWVRLVPMDNPDGTVRWRLLDYNHGPAIADTDEWERER